MAFREAPSLPTPGQLASLTDAKSQVTSYVYDNGGNKLHEIYPEVRDDACLSGVPTHNTRIETYD